MIEILRYKTPVESTHHKMHKNHIRSFTIRIGVYNRNLVSIPILVNSVIGVLSIDIVSRIYNARIRHFNRLGGLEINISRSEKCTQFVV